MGKRRPEESQHAIAQQLCDGALMVIDRVADALVDLGYHGAGGDTASRITRLIPLVEGRGACRHPDGATQLAASALTAFAHDVRWHDERGPCFGVRRAPLLPVPGDVEYW